MQRASHRTDSGGSLSPIALDRPTRASADVAGAYRPIAASLERTVSTRRKPSFDKRLMLAAAGAIAFLSLVSAVSLRAPQPARAPAQAHVRRVLAAHEALLIPVRMASAKDLVVLDEDDLSIPVSALPGHRVRRR